MFARAAAVACLALVFVMGARSARAQDTAASIYVGQGAVQEARLHPVQPRRFDATRWPYTPWTKVRSAAADQLSADIGQLPSTAMRASFYGGGPRSLEPNTHTANGERFNQWAMTAAHRSLPFGTRLQVCHARCVVVRVNDRGPAKWTGKSLDLSRGAARAIGFPGVGTVRVAVLG